MQRTMHFEKEKTANVEKISIVGDSESMIKLKKNILRVAESRADTVLVHGESGSGKSLLPGRYTSGRSMRRIRLLK